MATVPRTGARSCTQSVFSGKSYHGGVSTRTSFNKFLLSRRIFKKVVLMHEVEFCDTAACAVCM